MIDTHATNNEPLLRCEHVNKHYDDGDVAAIVELDLAIRPGEYVAIMGPSGCGKSTLLNMLGALDLPTSGEVYFEGQPLSGLRTVDRLRPEDRLCLSGIPFAADSDGDRERPASDVRDGAFGAASAS